MANPKLTVEIDADVSRMEKELSKANKLLAQHERNYAGVQKAISSNTQTARNLERQLSQLNSEFKSGAVSEKMYARETDRLSKELREVNSSTSSYQRELRRLENEMQRAKNATDNFNSSTGRTQTATSTANTQMGRLAKTTKVNAVPAMTSFSQVIQDAPYGINGVANNIQQLTMMFGYLQKSTGSAGSALKAMLASLSGPAGILLAVSAVTSAMSYMANAGIGLSDVMGMLTGQFGSAELAGKKYAASMRDAAASTQGEIEVINSLMGVINDETASREKRNQAVQILQDKYPQYLSNLNAENSTTKEIKTAVDQLTQSLEKRAKVQAATSLISEKAEELFKQRIELAKEEQEAVEESLANQRQAYNSYARNIGNANFNYAKNREETEKRIGEEFASRLKEQEDEYSSFIQSLNKMVGETDNLFDLFGDPTGDVGGGTGEPIRIPVEPVYDFSQLQRGFEDAPTMELFQGGTGFKKMIEDDIALMKVAQSYFSEFSKEYKMIGEQIEFAKSRAEGFGTSLVESGKMASDELKRIGEGLTAFSETQQEELLAQQEAFAERQKMIAGLVGNAVGQVSNEMVDMALEGEFAFDKLAKSLFKATSRILTTLLSQAIGNAVLGATQASTAAGPAAPLVLPGLLVGMTGSVQSAFPAFKDGGVVGGNSLYGDKILARVNSQELILNRQQQAAVWGQMNTGAAMGHSAPIELVGSTVVEGENLRVILERNNRNRGRQT